MKKLILVIAFLLFSSTVHATPITFLAVRFQLMTFSLADILSILIRQTVVRHRMCKVNITTSAHQGSVGGLSFSITPNNINPFSIFVNDNNSWDDYFFRGDFEGQNAFGLGVDRVIFDLDLHSTSTNVFSSTDLLLLPPDIGLFDKLARVRLAGGSVPFFDIRATLTDISLIPEPTTIALLGIGLADLAGQK